jgi:hypothetical protein
MQTLYLARIPSHTARVAYADARRSGYSREEALTYTKGQYRQVSAVVGLAGVPCRKPDGGTLTRGVKPTGRFVIQRSWGYEIYV